MKTYLPNETVSQALARGLVNLKDLRKMVYAKGKSYDPRVYALSCKINEIEYKLDRLIP